MITRVTIGDNVMWYLASNRYYSGVAEQIINWIKMKMNLPRSEDVWGVYTNETVILGGGAHSTVEAQMYCTYPCGLHGSRNTRILKSMFHKIHRFNLSRIALFIIWP